MPSDERRRWAEGDQRGGTSDGGVGNGQLQRGPNDGALGSGRRERERRGEGGVRCGDGVAVRLIDARERASM